MAGGGEGFHCTVKVFIDLEIGTPVNCLFCSSASSYTAWVLNTFYVKMNQVFVFLFFFVVEKMWLKNYNTICRILAELCIDKLCKNEFPMDMCEWRDSVLYFQDYFKECLNLRFCSKCHILKWYFFFIHIIILHSIFLTVGF